jgi:hypothetical protein
VPWKHFDNYWLIDMSPIRNPPNEPDPRLQQMLAAYGDTPERDLEAARRTEARFRAELDELFPESLPSRPAAGSRVPSIIRNLNDNLTRWFTKRPAVLLGLSFMVLWACFFAGAGTTAYAASSALPGDRLYSLKTTMESVRADLTLDSAQQARLYIDFAGRRLAEMQLLVQKSRYDDISRAARELEMDIQQSARALQTLTQTNPLEAAQLNVEFSPVLRGYSAALTHLLDAIPGSVRPALERAIETCNAAAGGNGSMGGGDHSTPTVDPGATPNDDSPTPAPEASTPMPAPRPTGDDDGGDDDDNGADDDDDDGGDDDDD